MEGPADSAELRSSRGSCKSCASCAEKCPWDREQTLASNSRNVIEEAYEVADAIAGGADAAVAEELGDILMQALFIATIAAEQSRFTLAEVARNAADKLVRRHPHVYAGVNAETVEQVLTNWEKIKAQEKKTSGGDPALRDADRALPALMRAEKLGEKTRRKGMDWTGVREVLQKVREELDETEAALARGDHENAATEIGDMMLALANAPRFIGHNAEETLRRACVKFADRFEKLERLASSRQLDLKKLSAPELEALWQEAKRA